MKHVLKLATLLLLLAGTVRPARILALIPAPAKSHFNSISNLLEDLAKRGHEVTVISAFPRSQPLENYKDVAVDNILNEKEFNMFETRSSLHPALMVPIMLPLFFYNCEKYLSNPQVQDIIHSDQKFDLIITEIFFSECIYGFVHRFKAPFIQFSSNTIVPWMGDGVGNPSFPSHNPDILLVLSDRMTFMERVHNTLFGVFMIFIRDWIVIPRMESIIQTHFKDPSMPSVKEIEANASFLLLNSHTSLNYPRPFTPNTAEVGGMHIKDPKKLPDDLKKYLDEATEGVIYFSFGSHIKSVQMPENIRNNFIKGFSQLKQKVLWKWEADSLPGQPKNVRIEKWLPQNDLLTHPNVKMFITHGGLLSTQEATFHGMPLITVPIAGDQVINAMKAGNAGYAVVLELNNITAESLTWAINEVLSNPSYRENAQRLSKIFRDQPEKPLDRAVFWVEYVLRHNGAPHMKSAALHLNFFQYYSLDVIAVVLVCSLAVLVGTVLTCKAACRRIFSKKTQSVSGSKKNK